MKKAFVLFLLAISSIALWAQEKSDVSISKEKKQHPKPLIVINGLKMNQADSISILDAIDPNIVSSIEVLKGDRAIEKYGHFEIRGDRSIMEPMDALLASFVSQGRMKLPGKAYEPCYHIIK